jgi:hypothetical protein
MAYQRRFVKTVVFVNSSPCCYGFATAVRFRKEFETILEVMYCNDSISCTSSSDEEDLDLILLDLALKPKQIMGPRLHLEDLTDVDCERFFR